MSGSIATLISDFSSPVPSEGFGIGILRRVRQNTEPESAPVQPTVDHQAELIRSVETRARNEEREKARRQLDEVLNAEREKHREELAVQRELWVEQEAQQLSSQMIAALGNLEAILSEKAARILVSVIPEALQQRAVAEFKAHLGTILSGETETLVKVSGPEDLLSAVKAGMAPREGIIEFIPSHDVELTLVAGDTTIQTQFGAWSERLRDLLKADPSC
ncbi:hypothetical protein MHY87_03900 [Microvirga sp. ACRRW]|uniref:hypothetical protein n=1 Tax=Microvirga sp. ACRRW TaxID=2918205 RepID=UPI001EF63B4E|nr:hypothetical protein [Microvirga sp. ACRRW]MCG7392044.1 hypothetical protein [Microvirga sp. ACRRW]